jgi:NAD(P)-dependent dehydrogenase (short-subunit alcohol dehydrogenase family)
VSNLHSRATNQNLFAPIEPYNSWTAYGASKLAMIHMASELDRRHGGEGVHGYSLHPGSVFTKIADKGLANSPVLARVRKTMAPIESRMLLSAAEGAQTSVHCATAPDVEPGYYRDCHATSPSSDSLDPEVSARLWDETQAWISSQ